jgi:hypothetical protein
MSNTSTSVTSHPREFRPTNAKAVSHEVPAIMLSTQIRRAPSFSTPRTLEIAPSKPHDEACALLFGLLQNPASHSMPIGAGLV